MTQVLFPASGRALFVPYPVEHGPVRGAPAPRVPCNVKADQRGGREGREGTRPKTFTAWRRLETNLMTRVKHFSYG